MMETEKGKRIEQILATDVTREQLAEALWCAESSQRMWHGCAEENRSFRLKAEAENAKLRELVRDYEHCSVHADCDRCEYDGTMSTHCPLSPCFPDIDELNELGVEVTT